MSDRAGMQSVLWLGRRRLEAWLLIEVVATRVNDNLLAPKSPLELTRTY